MTMVDRLIAAMTATGLDYADWHDDPKRELAIAALKAMPLPEDAWATTEFTSDQIDQFNYMLAKLSEQP